MRKSTTKNRLVPISTEYCLRLYTINKLDINFIS